MMIFLLYSPSSLSLTFKPLKSDAVSNFKAFLFHTEARTKLVSFPDLVLLPYVFFYSSSFPTTDFPVVVVVVG